MRWTTRAIFKYGSLFDLSIARVDLFGIDALLIINQSHYIGYLFFYTVTSIIYTAKYTVIYYAILVPTLSTPFSLRFTLIQLHLPLFIQVVKLS